MIEMLPGYEKTFAIDWTRVQAVEQKGPMVWMTLVSGVECMTTLSFQEVVHKWSSVYPLQNRILVAIEDAFAFDLYRVQMVDFEYAHERYEESYVATMVSGVKCPISKTMSPEQFISIWSSCRDKSLL